MPAAADAAAPPSIFLYPFPSVQAGDVGRCVTDAEAGVSGQAYCADSLADAMVVAGVSCGVCESASAIGRGTSEASGAWPQRRSGRDGGGGLWSAMEGRPWAPWSSGRDRRCAWADGLRGLGRDGP